jgi:hypothetical protein
MRAAVRGLVGLCALALATALAGCGPTEPAARAAPPTMRRLSNDQYRNTIADVFGPHVVVAGQADALTRTDGLLADGARLARITPSGIEKFYGLAKAIAAQVVSPENRDANFPCAPADTAAADDACAKAFFTRVGRLLYRRPLSAAEIDLAVASARDGAKTYRDFYRGVATGLVGMLTTPQFLYVVDETEPDPAHPGAQRLTGYAKAARLSFLLWNTTPNDVLLAAAESGELHTAAGLAKQVDRMMASPRLDAGVRAFFEDFFRFDQFDTLEKDSVIYPAFTLKVVEDAREQVLKTILGHLIERNGDYRDLYTTRKTFVTGALARIYRVPTARPSGGWTAYEFPEDDPRSGILTQIGFAALASHPGRSSPTLRGRALREQVLCQKVPDPPGNVDFTKFESPENVAKTARERLDAHRTAPACAGCHAITDPIGLGLENLDGLGQFRLTENGAPIDPSGDLDGVHFADAAGLGKAVRDHPATPSCLVDRLASYALGRHADDKAFIAYLQKAFADDGYRFPPLLRRIALSEAFYAVAPAPAQPTTTAESKP